MFLRASATYTVPTASTAMPQGPEKSAAVPTPLLKPEVVPAAPPPASVTTVWSG